MLKDFRLVPLMGLQIHALRSSTDCSKTGKDDSVFYYKSEDVIESMQNIDNKKIILLYG